MKLICYILIIIGKLVQFTMATMLTEVFKNVINLKIYIFCGTKFMFTYK